MSGCPSALHGHAPRRGQLADARDLQHPWAAHALGAWRCARPRVGGQGGSPRRLRVPRAPRPLPSCPVRSSRAPCVSERGHSRCRWARSRGRGSGRAARLPGTRPCHSHDAQPPGTASGARPPPLRVGGGRDGLGWGVAPPLAAPAPPSSPALPRRAGPESPRDSAVAAGAGPREGGARVSGLTRSPGLAPPGTPGAGPAAGPASWCRPRRAGSRSSWWLGLVAVTGKGHSPRGGASRGCVALVAPCFPREPAGAGRAQVRLR